MRITSKGQVTIPQEVREKAGLLPGTDVDIVLDGGEVRIVKARPTAARRSRGQRMVERLRGTGTVKLTTDEIMRLMRGDDEDKA